MYRSTAIYLMRCDEAQLQLFKEQNNGILWLAFQRFA